jgi:hypothetical protein
MVPDRITPDWIRQRLADGEVTQSDAAELCAVDPRTMRRWLAGDREMPRSAAVLLDARLYLRAGDTRRALAAINPLA